jgi:hypothetical protein
VNEAAIYARLAAIEHRLKVLEETYLPTQSRSPSTSTTQYGPPAEFCRRCGHWPASACERDDCPMRGGS